MARNALAAFIRLPHWERALLLRAIWTLALARVAVRLMPFARARRLLSPRHIASTPSRASALHVRWAIAQAQRVIPDATCLPQALAAEALLRRAGRQVTLRLGAQRTAAGGFLAHAWAESEGRIVVGDLPGGLGEYAAFPELPPPWPEAAP